jgi:predicted AAA+ superfamily ATPase
MEDIRKPVLMHSLFLLGTHHSAQELSHRTISGLLGNVGTASTVARYLGLLDDAGLLCGLNRFGASLAKSTGSSTRFLVHDTSLMAATRPDSPDTFIQTAANRGRLVESAVGCYLLTQSKVQHFDLTWWREGNYEVDYVARKGPSIYAIEIRSGRTRTNDCLAQFCQRFDEAQPIVVGDANISCESFARGEVPLF